MDRARTLVLSGRGAVLQDMLKLIQTLSGKVENICLQELTDILERDPIVVSRVLSAANTVRNNPCISPLTSLSHAVHQVGFQKISSIAVSMMLLEGAAGTTQSPEQRAAAAHALCAGLISRSCADSLGYADPDLLFACGTLRNLGAVLLPAMAPEHCREVGPLRETMPEDQACRHIFGLTPLDLSREMISTLRMPKEVLYAMQDCQPEDMTEVATHLSGRILCITEFSSQLASLALSPKLSSTQFLEQAQALAQRFEQIVPEAGTLIAAAMEHTHEQLTALTRHGNFISPTVFSRLRAHVKLITQPQVDPASADASPGVSTTEVTATATATATTNVVTAEAGLTAETDAPALTTAPVTRPSAPTDSSRATSPVAPPAAEAESEAELRLASGQPMDWAEQLAGSIAFESQAEALPADALSLGAEDPWVSVLATIQQVMQADHCAIFLGRKGGKRASLHRWTGGFGGTGGATPVCTTTERTVFGVCLMRHETVLIHDGFNSSLDNYLPLWMGRDTSRPGAFLLFALSTEQPAEGFVYLTWKKPRKIVVTAAQTSLIRSLIAPHLAEFALVESR
ncbi:MAG: HDOD domain-containing protein [Opitutus sp.]|nr:HDOD domain-containing protein [Opitutus sp.]